MKAIVSVKRAVDYNVRIQVKADGSGVVVLGAFDLQHLCHAIKLRGFLRRAADARGEQRHVHVATDLLCRSQHLADAGVQLAVSLLANHENLCRHLSLQPGPIGPACERGKT